MKIAFIGLGGFGAKRILDLNQEKEKLGENTTLHIVDGSDSDIFFDATFDKENIHLVPDVDGGGGVRKNQAETYVGYIRANHAKIVPPDAHIVVLFWSAAGASGSVLGPELCNILVDKGVNTLNVLHFAANDYNKTINTLNVLRGMANMSARLATPVMIAPFDAASAKMSDINDQATAIGLGISELAARRYVGLDTADISTFFNYHRNGPVPQLTLVKFLADDELLAKQAGHVLGSITITCNDDYVSPDTGSLYDIVGKTDAEIDTFIMYSSLADMQSLSKDLEARANKRKEELAALSATKGFGGDASQEMEY